MNDVEYSWEEDMVCAFFHEELADVIMQVLISTRGRDDFASSQHDKHGLYLVKSAYNLAKTVDFFSKQELQARGLVQTERGMRDCGKQCGHFKHQTR
jgi:hypothetical protein